MPEIMQLHATNNSMGEISSEQAGAELGQAQLKLGLGFTSTIDS